MDDDDARRARAEARRARMTLRVTTLDDDTPPPPPETVAERLQLVYALSMRAFALSGQPWPSYERATMPGRVCWSFTEADEA